MVGSMGNMELGIEAPLGNEVTPEGAAVDVDGSDVGADVGVH